MFGKATGQPTPSSQPPTATDHASTALYLTRSHLLRLLEVSQDVAPFPPQDLEHDGQVVVLQRGLVVVQVRQRAFGGRLGYKARQGNVGWGWNQTRGGDNADTTDISDTKEREAGREGWGLVTKGTAKKTTRAERVQTHKTDTLHTYSLQNHPARASECLQGNELKAQEAANGAASPTYDTS